MKKMWAALRPDKQPGRFILLIAVLLSLPMIRLHFYAIWLYTSFDSDSPNGMEKSQRGWDQADLLMVQADRYFYPLLVALLCGPILAIWQKYLSFVPGNPMQPLGLWIGLVIYACLTLLVRI